MIKITLAQLAAVTNALGDNQSGAFQRLLNLSLPAVASYKISRASKKIVAEWDLLREQCFALVKKHGNEIEDGPGSWQVRDENRPAYDEELDKLLALEIELDIKPIHIELIGDENISVADLMALDFLFTDG